MLNESCLPGGNACGNVYVLPFNSKPAALLYTTNQYSWSDTFKFGITMMFISWLMILLWG